MCFSSSISIFQKDVFQFARDNIVNMAEMEQSDTHKPANACNGDKKLHDENTLASIWRPPLDYVFSIVLLAVIYITGTIIWTEQLPLQTFHGSWQAAFHDVFEAKPTAYSLVELVRHLIWQV